jgi:hypothetical protein
MRHILRRSFLLLVLCAVVTPLQAALQMSIHCTQQAGGADCMATTTNTGATVSGDAYTGFMVEAPLSQVTLSGFTNSFGLTQCFDSTFLGPQASVPFVFCFDFGRSFAAGATFTSSVRVSSRSGAVPTFPVVAFSGLFSDTSEASGYVSTDVQAPTCTPAASVAPIVSPGIPYTVAWTQVSEANATYEVQESTTPDFSSNVQTITTTNTSATFQHTVNAATRYHYRVRAIACGGSAGTFSPAVTTVVQFTPPQDTSSNSIEAATAFGSTTPVRIPLRIPGAGAGATFTASVDKPYFTLDVSSGSLPADGLVVNLNADPRDLPPGASTGTLTVTTTTPDARGRLQTHGSTTNSTPVSVSLVTPVTPTTKTTPGPDAVIIPVVTHVNGAAGPFLSDVRLTNEGPAETTYQVTLTPTRTDVTQSKSTKVSVASGQTVALNDIMKNFFGVGVTADPADAGAGSLDIRPIGSSNLLTFASSRTYARTAAGTFGQFIAAIPVAKFASNVGNTIPVPGQPPAANPRVLSLQQIAQSAKFRTNLGLVEGSGFPASGRIRVLGTSGSLLAEIPYSLKPGEHQQINSFLAANGINNLEDGRIEITIDSPQGAVTGYASVLDNLTTDPLAVMPADPGSINSTRYVLPGVADLGGVNNFHSDVRIFNGGSSVATVSLTYYPQTNPEGAVSAAPISIAPGEVKVFDNVLPSVFNATATGGAMLLTTNAPTSLVVTGRTYSIDSRGGTFGQFIPGVTPIEGVGAGDRALQVLQLEESQNFRSNLGLAELTGNPATVRVTLYMQEHKVTASTEVQLKANEFRQLNRVIALMTGSTNVYNARVAVQVVSGTGRVTAYGSVIDNDTLDPSYVPAQ